MGNFFDSKDMASYIGNYPRVTEKEIRFYMADIVSIVTQIEKKYRDGKISDNEAQFFYDILVEAECFFKRTREEVLYAKRTAKRQ